MPELPPILGTDQIRERYGLRDPRAARKIMREAGGFVVAGRLVVRSDDLDRWERDRPEQARTAAAAPPRSQEAPRRRAKANTQAAPAERYAGEWWREGAA